VSPEP